MDGLLEEESIIPTSLRREQVTLEYSEGESVRTYLDVAQRVVLQLVLDDVLHLGFVRERRTDV